MAREVGHMPGGNLVIWIVLAVLLGAGSVILGRFVDSLTWWFIASVAWFAGTLVAVVRAIRSSGQEQTSATTLAVTGAVITLLYAANTYAKWKAK